MTTALAKSLDNSLQRDAQALHVALSNLLRVYQFRDRDKICCHDISVTQCYALEILAERGAQRSQALAQALLLDKSTTTRVVDALVRKNYVQRLPDPEDARALALTITDAGRALYDRINDGLIAQQVELIGDMDPHLRGAAIELVRRLSRAAEARFVSGISVSCAPADCSADGDNACR